MEQNLKQYVEKFKPILETEIFSKEECKKIINKLVEKQEKWENRSPNRNFFMSYGALTYLDAVDDGLGVANDPEYDQFRNINKSIPNIYKQKANYFNEMMVKDFDWMYRKIWGYYQMKFHKPVIFQLALPGFHIFQTAEQLNHKDIKNLATIHVDQPHTSHSWGEDILAVSSFTMEGQPYDFYSYDLSVQPSPPFNHSLFQEKQSHPYQWEAGAYGTNFSFHIKMAFTFKDSNGIQITKNIYIKFNWAGDTSNEEFWNHPNTSIPYYCTPCDLGDLNNDGGQNVLDVVSMANCILDDDCYDRGYGCSGDMNADGGINIIDVVTLANLVLNQDD